MEREAIYDALTVASVFKFYNTWNNGSGGAEHARGGLPVPQRARPQHPLGYRGFPLVAADSAHGGEVSCSGGHLPRRAERRGTGDWDDGKAGTGDSGLTRSPDGRMRPTGFSRPRSQCVLAPLRPSPCPDCVGGATTDRESGGTNPSPAIPLYPIPLPEREGHPPTGRCARFTPVPGADFGLGVVGAAAYPGGCRRRRIAQRCDPGGSPDG